jgi:hypothetical protein
MKGQNYAPWELFTIPCCLYSKWKCFRFLPYLGTAYLCKHPTRFSSTGLPGLDDRFLVPLHLMLRFTSYIWCVLLHCCYWYSSLFAFLIVSWAMTSPSVWLKSGLLIVDGLYVKNQTFHLPVIFAPLHFHNPLEFSKSEQLVRTLITSGRIAWFGPNGSGSQLWCSRTHWTCLSVFEFLEPTNHPVTVIEQIFSIPPWMSSSRKGRRSLSPTLTLAAKFTFRAKIRHSGELSKTQFNVFLILHHMSITGSRGNLTGMIGWFSHFLAAVFAPGRHLAWWIRHCFGISVAKSLGLFLAQPMLSCGSHSSDSCLAKGA